MLDNVKEWSVDPIFNCLAPPINDGEGPMQLLLSLDFSVNTLIDVDISDFLKNGRITTIQSLYFDNSLNAASTKLIVTELNLKSRLVFRGLKQGFVPFMCSQFPKIRFELTSASPLAVKVGLINVPVSAVMWDT